jgi:hypothetical protein
MEFNQIKKEEQEESQKSLQIIEISPYSTTTVKKSAIIRSNNGS